MTTTNYVVPISDRLGVTMHPAQPDRIFLQNRVLTNIASKKPKETFHLYTYKEKQHINVDFMEHIGLIF